MGRVSLTVARGILLAGDESLRVEETPVGAGPYLVDDIGLQVNVERAGNVLSRRRLGEERAKAIVIMGGRAFDKTAVRLENQACSAET